MIKKYFLKIILICNSMLDISIIFSILILNFMSYIYIFFFNFYFKLSILFTYFTKYDLQMK